MMTTKKKIHYSKKSKSMSKNIELGRECTEMKSLRFVAIFNDVVSMQYVKRYNTSQW